MSISYPLNFPTVKAPSEVTISADSVVAVTQSPLTLTQQVYVHQGGKWNAEWRFAPMNRADAETIIGFLLSLNGQEGTFLAGDPVGVTARGTWASASPYIYGSHAANVRTLSIDGAQGLAWSPGDWLQIGMGASTHLHKVSQAGSQTAGSPTVAGTLEIWPSTRAAYSQGEVLTLSSAKGLWRLASNSREWTIRRAKLFGISFSAMEAL